MNAYFNALTEVLNTRNDKDNRPIPLNLSIPAEYNCICEMCGGEDSFLKEFPQLYELVEHTRKHHLNNNIQQTYNTQNGFTNAVYINDCIYDTSKKELYAFGKVYLTKKIKRIFVTLTVKNKNKNNEEQVIGFNSISEKDCSSISISCNNQNLDLADYNATTIIHATWEDYNNLLESYVTEKKVNYTLEEIIDNDIIVNNPRHKNSPVEGDINVCYQRKPIASELIDYTYPEARIEGNQKVFLDISGNAPLKSGYTFLKVVPNSVNIILNCDGAGGIWYNADNQESYITATNNGFQWQFSNDWINYIPESVRYGNRQYQFDMQFLFQVTQNNNKYPITVSSYKNPQKSNHYKEISSIRLYWGCVEENTEVLMSDRTKKMIQDVKLGDSVMTNPDGRTAIVTNIWTGTDEDMFCVYSENNCEIHASMYHPIVTRNGLKALIDLTSNDEFLMESGYQLIKYAFPIAGQRKVYNLELSGNVHTMICNGFVIGDNIAQGQVMEQMDDNDDNISVDSNQSMDDQSVQESQKLQAKLLTLKEEISK